MLMLKYLTQRPLEKGSIKEDNLFVNKSEPNRTQKSVCSSNE